MAMTLRTYRRHRDHAATAEHKTIRRVAADEIIDFAYAAGSANTTGALSTGRLGASLTH